MKEALRAFNELNEYNRKNKNLFCSLENTRDGITFIKVRARLKPVERIPLKKIISIAEKNNGKLSLNHTGTIEIKFKEDNE